MKLKTLSKEAIPRALAKAERYRLLNDPLTAEGICHDILEIDHENQQALVMLLLSLTDQFTHPMQRVGLKQPGVLIPRLQGDYEKAYYQGIICERWAKALLFRGILGAGPMAYEYLRDALEWYEKAHALHKSDNDDALLHWNSCIRCIDSHKLSPPSASDTQSSHFHD